MLLPFAVAVTLNDIGEIGIEVSISTKGPEWGKPSWRALIRRIADGELKLESEKQ